MANKLVAVKKGALGWVIFNRPQVKNAFDLEMWERLPRTIANLAEDPEIRVILLKGEGGHFGAGADIKELLEYAKKPFLAQVYANTVDRCFTAMGKIEKPLIAVVEGHALGGGAMVATACDLRVVSKKATVGIPLPQLGLAVVPLGIKKLIETVGLAWASKFLLTADIIPIEDLKASGWASVMADEEKVEEEAIALGERIMRNYPTAIQMTKRIIREWLTPSYLRDPKVLRESFSRCMLGDEFKEGARAFIEKRKPNSRR